MSFNKNFNRIAFAHKVLNLLPTQWVLDFRAYEMLSVFSLVCYINMVYNHLDKTQLEKIMKLCIETVNTQINQLDDDTPYAVLRAINKQKNAMDKLAHRLKNTDTNPSKIQLVLDKGKFTGEMYALTRSRKCKNSNYILLMYCNEPAKRIQKAWQRYQQNKSARIIQSMVTKWLYKPDGIMMKKAEVHFYKMSGKE